MQKNTRNLCFDRRGRRCDPRRAVVFGAALAAVLGGATHTPAATTVWTGPSTGGVFNDDANWSGVAPGNDDPATDLAIFNSATNVDGTITFNADATHFRTFVQNDAGTIAFDTGEHTWTMSSFFLTGTAVSEDNHIQFIGGHVVAQFYLMGNTSGATNGDIIEVIGADTQLEATATGGAFRVGSGGSDNTQFIVRDGATATSPGQIIIGLVDAANGLMKVTGEDTTVTVGASIQVGGGLSAQAENNRLEVLDGAHVTGDQLLMGVTEFGDNNTTLVSGAGSTLSIVGTGRSDIGRVGAGHTLQIEDGGKVDGSANYVLGVDAASVGNNIHVNGAGAGLTGSGVEARRGALNVNGGDVVLNDFFNANDGVFEGGNLVANTGATGMIHLNTGSISTVHADVANGSPFVVGDGSATPATYHMLKTGDDLNGTHSFADGLMLSSNATLSGSGDVVGNVSGDAGAKVDVGASAGVIHVDGDWDHTGMELALEIGDLSSLIEAGTTHDLLDIVGTFTHGGSVEIDLTAFVAPTPQELKLIGWGAQSGDPSNTAVSFVGGDALPVSVQTDGLFVLVPEPAAAGFMVIGLFAGAMRRRSVGRLHA